MTNFWQEARNEHKDRRTVLTGAHVPPTDEVLVQAYRDGLPIINIARKYHTYSRRVSNALHEAGIHLRRGRKEGVDRTLMNSPDPCPQLTNLMNLCCGRVKNCPIEQKCVTWYDGCIGKMSCEEQVKGFLEMREDMI